jgi:hypothetical protein
MGNWQVMANLLRESWKDLDSHELRLLLEKRLGGRGQYDGRAANPNKLYLPLARASCRVALTFRDGQIVAVEPGPAFNPAEWQSIADEIENAILVGPRQVGREYSFSGFRVLGSWRGTHSGVQILPPPPEAPRASVEMAAHPFILEFPIIGAPNDLWPITNHRRFGESRWVQQFFWAALGAPVTDALSSPALENIAEIEPEEYYTNVGYDGNPPRVPADLDDSLCRHRNLSEPNRSKFDRALFWLDIASRQWNSSVSSSFASLVTAIESLTFRGSTHRVYCQECQAERSHEVPGATERFRLFFETYAPGASLRQRRTQMYELRSGILHGSYLMQIDQNLHFGWDPPGFKEDELHRELWSITRLGLRNWLKSPPDM